MRRMNSAPAAAHVRNRCRRWSGLLLPLAGVFVGIAGAADNRRTFADLLERADRGDLQAVREADLTSRTVPERLLLQARLALSRFDIATASGLLDRYEALDDAEPARLREALSQRQNIALLATNYAAAATFGKDWEQVPGAQEDAQFADHRQTTVFAQQLAEVPPLQISGSIQHRRHPTSKDKIGLARTLITVGEHEQEAVIDTGAGFSVLSASAAQRLGLELLQGSATLGSTTQRAIETRFAVAPQVIVAGTRFVSAVFLVLEDSQLEFPVEGGYRIDAILGFPELSRLGRIAFDETHMEVLPSKDFDPAAFNLMLVGGRLFVAAGIGELCVPLFLDSGANVTSLTSVFAASHPDLMRTLPRSSGKVGGAGGMRDVSAFSWHNVPVAVGASRVVLPNVRINEADPVPDVKEFGTLGRDMLAQGYTIDFRAMRLELHRPPSPEKHPCASR